ncbi:RNA polymerase sigma-70 factor [Mucilaginibacter sabulilitoris]|uniref:RNA polymerase sigma-70 factor n=1 Tax=Mucilaginibacter sabulilitoris TaxID=1173583 RepID=A0ABZ0TUG1_9SPHI|nr:RNA polymerase sigma-70 factor [Mucilaginibacter sabulilitoris]WPU96112.1 RNA polymerase sigma-70 factor [Mucilaginibacter sabulilitoris]
MSPKWLIVDQELVALLREGNKEAFAEIYRRYWTVMYMHALKMLKSEDDARDVVQEIFTSLWLKSQSINPDVNLAGYLFISTKNRVLDLIAQKRVRTDYLGSLAAFAEAHNNETLADIEEKELMQALQREIEQLPAKMRQIFEMRIHQHCTYKEIADELNLSDKTVKKQISNAIKIIRPKLHHLSTIVLILSGL